MADGYSTFDDGLDGWDGTAGYGGVSAFDTAEGNPAPCYHVQYADFMIFGMTIHNDTNTAFLGDYTVTPQVDFTVDTKTTVLNCLGFPTSRDLVLMLVDHDGDVPAGVWTYIALLDEADPNWLTWTASITDTSAVDLPVDWYGYGAYDPDTFEPMLPEGRTFTDVLAGVDEISLTTYIPGVFFTDSYYDVAVDNIGVFQVPEPTAVMLLLVGVAWVSSRRR